MPIVFQCPHCGEDYRLKDDLAGKKATCKRVSCRKVFTVPLVSTSNVAAAPAPDAEALALSALADDAIVQKAISVIQVTCKSCDHIWDVEAAKQGKNVTCPECRTINKVPIPKETSRQDWRAVGNQGLPEGAKLNQMPKLEGATVKETVSTQALTEAGAIPKIEYEPLTLGQKFSRFAMVFVPLLTIGTGYYLWKMSKDANQASSLVKDSVKEIAGEEGTKQAEYHMFALMASGEHKVRASQNEKAMADGLKDLQNARSKLASIEKPIDRGVLMLELVSIFNRLAGDKPQIDANTRRSWNEVQKEVRQTLQNSSNLDSDFRWIPIGPMLSRKYYETLTPWKK
jgi:phage FluMu protein Com